LRGLAGADQLLDFAEAAAQQQQALGAGFQVRNGCRVVAIHRPKRGVAAVQPKNAHDDDRDEQDGVKGYRRDQAAANRHVFAHKG
jgi:hypothetical protein